MALTINGQVITPTDRGDGPNHGTGDHTGCTYFIDLTTQNHRALLRAERDDLRSQKDVQIGIRDTGNQFRDAGIAQRDQGSAIRDAAVVEIDALNIRIEEIRTFLTSVGDDPDV